MAESAPIKSTKACTQNANEVLLAWEASVSRGFGVIRRRYQSKVMMRNKGATLDCGFHKFHYLYGARFAP